MSSVSIIKAAADILIEEESEPEKKEMLLKIMSRSDLLVEQVETLNDSL